MKKLMFLISAFLIFSVLTGCSNTDPVAEELISYINEQMTPLGKEEQELLNAYESVTGENYKDDETTHKVLVEEVIPGYNEYIGKIEAIKIESKELREVHEIYIDGLNLQISAITSIAIALEQQDGEAIVEANEKLSEARKMMREFQTKLKELTKEHKIKIENNKNNS
ncbi:hypothetical protein [Paenibacillus sp. XY044]|uniref:hypothetical protein n=1 Tax=Paenibacillus sp. XY044 TaxID=2026089 RepID=UPI000B97F277|nr:hypothetical protein [Paenibacillus sp. XY044]OZB98058.1 hypothetical protein CJP46_02510 [Paenibacillus sp. XY044]